MLALAVVGSGLIRQKLEMSLDDIRNICENGRCALLAVLINQETQAFKAALVHRCFDFLHWGFASHLVAANRLETDWLQHVNPVDNPADCRLPVDCLEDSPSSRRSHYVIRDALNLHFRAREASVVAPDL